jgi:hypothetical protein
MKSKLTLFLCLLLAVSLKIHSQEINQFIADDKAGREILCGMCDKKGLQMGEFKSYFKDFYKEYIPDSTTLSKIQGNLEGISITLVLGTWCSDSKEQVPRFYHVLDGVSFDLSKLRQICVDSSKAACGVDISDLDIQKVPTFIFYKDGKELGRIIETPVTSLEKDMLMIISD